MENITAQFEALPKWAKVIIIVLATGLFSALYRIFRYTETKNTTTLVVGILSFTFVGFFVAIADLVTELTDDRVKFFAE